MFLMLQLKKIFFCNRWTLNPGLLVFATLDHNDLGLDQFLQRHLYDSAR